MFLQPTYLLSISKPARIRWNLKDDPRLSGEVECVDTNLYNIIAHNDMASQVPPHEEACVYPRCGQIIRAATVREPHIDISVLSLTDARASVMDVLQLRTMTPRAPDLDLHPYFRDPAKAKAILDACIEDNMQLGRAMVRIVHGKGKGDFREMIHRHLEKHPDVEGLVLCDPLHGGDGATWVHLRTNQKAPESVETERQEKPASAGSWRWIVYAICLVLLYIHGNWWLLGTALATVAILEMILAFGRRES